MPGELILRICDVEHGACALLTHRVNGQLGRLAMIDCGDASDWSPTAYIKSVLRRNRIDYLFITNADQDHLSDLDGVISGGIGIGTLYRNPHPTPAQLRVLKGERGSISNDVERYIELHERWIHPVTEPFNGFMGGITATTYFNSSPRFTQTNDLSMVVSIQYAGFRIMFPGDLEEASWLALLERDDFRRELAATTVLVASHHGRESGFCEKAFDYCAPRAVVMSDKAIVHDTQMMTNAYRDIVRASHPEGILVRGSSDPRRVLTTRSDGHIEFEVLDSGVFYVSTEYPRG